MSELIGYLSEVEHLDGELTIPKEIGGGGGTLETITKTYTPTTSQQTEQITPSSGYDGIGEVDVTVNAMPTGTEGTPTATKGSVSNHAVQVTPSVTNQAGYIAGGTKTGTAVTVSASELVSGTKAITANGNNQDVVGYAAVDVAVPNSYSQSDEGKVVSNGALVAQNAHADVTPTTSDQTIDTTTNNSLKVKGDADLVAANIKKDVEIFGVTGSYEGGGGGTPEIEPKDVVFIDYDGTIVYTYTAQEFLALGAMPANPSHTGLTAQGWNWTWQDAYNYVSDNGTLVVGQNYITADGKTKIYITVDADYVDRPFYVMFKATVNGGVEIDWGDGNTETSSGTNYTARSHTYSTAGDYVVTLKVLDGNLEFGFWGSNSGAFFVNGTPTSVTTASWVQRIELGTVSVLGRNTFTFCTSLKSVSVPQGLSYDDSNGGFLNQCKNIQGFVFPNGLTTFRNWFQNCSNIKYIAIPKSVTSIAGTMGSTEIRKLTFPSLTSLIASFGTDFLYIDTLIVPGTYTSIPSSFCTTAARLRKIIIPASVTNIADRAYQDCYGAKEIHLKPTTVPTLTNSRAFSNFQGTFYVPYSADHSVLAAYQTATNWSTYASRMVEEPQS